MINCWPGRKDARPLVSIGLEDRCGRNVVATRQYFERVAGADDDGGPLGRGTSRRDRARRHCRLFRSGARAEHRRLVRALLRIPRRPSDRTAGRRSRVAGPAATAGGHIAEARGARPRRAARRPWLQIGRQRDFEKDVTTCRRCSRQNRSTSAPAPRRAVRDASKATRRHGTWLLTRTQQITVLSKHVPSKQPLKVTNKMLARTANPGF